MAPRLIATPFHRPAAGVVMLGLLIGAWASGGRSEPATPTQVPRADELTPIVVSVVAPPYPVLGADGRIHLAYELLLVNQSRALVTVEVVSALDRDGGTVIQTLTGPQLVSALVVTGDEGPGTTLGPSHSAYLWMDVTFARDVVLPRALEHQFILSQKVRQAPLDDHHGVPPGPGSDVSPSITFYGASTPVPGQPAIVLDPPLRGPRWVAGAGCCASHDTHRGAILSINGTIFVAERFAIDFLQLDESGRMFTGDQTKVASYPSYGAKVYSAADGVVVATRDGMPDQVPGKVPEGISADTAAGNHIVVDLGGGRFALYAHLQKGSPTVKKGDRVRRGLMIGLLGNSGNSNEPHLHFHVMDRPSPLAANGLPYVFTSFDGLGVVTSVEAVAGGNPAPVDRDALRGPHRNELPLDLQLVNFP